VFDPAAPAQRDRHLVTRTLANMLRAERSAPSGAKRARSLCQGSKLTAPYTISNLPPRPAPPRRRAGRRQSAGQPFSLVGYRPPWRTASGLGEGNVFKRHMEPRDFSEKCVCTHEALFLQLFAFRNHNAFWYVAIQTSGDFRTPLSLADPQWGKYYDLCITVNSKSCAFYLLCSTVVAEWSDSGCMRHQTWPNLVSSVMSLTFRL